MAKKDRDKHKSSKKQANSKALPTFSPGRNQAHFEFRDMTAERHFSVQLSQAQKLYAQEKFDEVVELLQLFATNFMTVLPC